jgi:hypothetical protein
MEDFSLAATVLRRARERIAAPERWARGTFAISQEGGDLGSSPAYWEPEDCLCVNAAILLAQHELFPSGSCATGAGLCISLAAKSRGYDTAASFNDAASTTHVDVLALLDEATALALALAERAS